jgi:DNA-binding NarL/FixJ family response regulator
MTRILIVDDHQFVRQQLRQMIAQNNQWQVCGEAADGKEAVQKYATLAPHLVVMDFNMPTVNGLAAARQILKDSPSACILMLSISDSSGLVEEIRDAGIKGFCSKNTMSEFFDAVEAVLRGQTYFFRHPN